MERKDRLDGLAIGLMLLLCALWGAQQVAIKQAVVQGLPPLFQGAARSAGAALLVAIWIAWREPAGALSGMLARGSARWPGLAIGMVFGLEFLALYPGLKLTTASRGVLFLYTAPFFTALGAHLFIPAERLRPRQALGLLVAFAGVAAAFADGLGQGSGNLLGDGLCALAALGWGVNTVMVKANPRLRAVPAAHMLLYQLGGSVPLLILGAALAGDLSQLPTASALAWGSLFYQTVIVAFASYLVWFWLISTYPATKISGFTFLTPLFGILAGAALLGEHASLALFAGLAAIVVGLRLLR